MPNLDHDDLKDDREAFEARLAELGPVRVRMMWAAGQFPTNHDIVLGEWLTAQRKDNA